MSVALTVPQWSVGTTISLFQLPGSLTWQNPTAMTGDPYYGAMFSNTSNTMFLTGNYAGSSTPGTLFTLVDNSSNAYQITLTVLPPQYTLSSAGVVYVGDSSTNLPITLTAPTNISATVNVVGLIPGPSNIIPRTISAVFTDYNFAPSLPGGLLSSMDGYGNVSITGMPTLLRAQSTYTFYGRTAINQTTSNVIPLQVASARYQFSNISGTVVNNASASAVFTYKVLNDIVVGITGVPGVLTYSSLPAGMSIGYNGTSINMSGIPTQFFEPSNVVVKIANPQYSNQFTFNLTMNPCLEIILQPDANAYFNVPYTSNAPIVSAYIRAFPDNQYTVISPSGSLVVSQTGGVYGTTTVDQSVTVFAQTPSLSNSATVNIHVIPDAVVFDTPPIVPVVQNIPYLNDFSAVASSGQPITYSVDPIFDGPIGLTLNTGTGTITGVPRGVSAFSNYTITAKTPQNVSASLPIVLSIIPDYITVSSYGLYAYCVSSNPIQMIQGHPIKQSEYDVSFGFRSETYSTDPIVGYLRQNFPPGVAMSTTGVLSGVPTSYGDFAGEIIVKSLNGVTTTLSMYFQIARDILILPISTDFIVEFGSTTSYTLKGYAFSASPIVSYGISNAPAGVSITPEGILTIYGGSYQTATPFTILALTYNGTQTTKDATLTVNDPTIGKFLAPIGPVVLQTSCPIVTDPPGFTFGISGSSDVGISGSNIVRLNANQIYPPVLTQVFAIQSLSTGGELAIPVRISTEQIEPFGIESYRWIQYVGTSITLSAGGVPSKVIFSVPNPPPGIRWNPIRSILTGSPSNLTIQDSFTVFATDGYSVTSFPIQYSVASPTYLRTFAAPSAYTNYVKQRAFVNAAAHAINGVAYMPDPMIATQGGQYPPDETKESICLKFKIPAYVTPTLYLEAMDATSEFSNVVSGLTNWRNVYNGQTAANYT